ncbi:MAG: metallophosphoesterase family protein [Verrucomicrobiota bacterium]
MDSRRIAVFSDIHSNLEALKAVLSDMDEMDVQDKFCLGDIVGYGPDPAKCLDLVRDIGCPILLGNHDEGCFALEPDSSFNTYALAGLELARRQLSDDQKDFMKTLPMKIEVDGLYRCARIALYREGLVLCSRYWRRDKSFPFSNPVSLLLRPYS